MRKNAVLNRDLSMTCNHFGQVRISDDMDNEILI